MEKVILIIYSQKNLTCLRLKFNSYGKSCLVFTHLINVKIIKKLQLKKQTKRELSRLIKMLYIFLNCIGVVKITIK